jgi:hypothetical protein
MIHHPPRLEQAFSKRENAHAHHMNYGYRVLRFLEKNELFIYL